MADQEKDSGSFLNFVREIIALRQSNDDLGNYSPFRVYSAEEGSRPFAYKRGGMPVAVNPSAEELALELDGDYEIRCAIGDSRTEEGRLLLGRQSLRC